MKINRPLQYLLALLTIIVFGTSIKLFNTYLSGGAYTRFTWITWLISLILLVVQGLIFRINKSSSTTGTINQDSPGELKSVGQNFILILILITATVIFRWTNIENLPYGYKGMVLDTAMMSEIAFRIIDGNANFSPVMPSMSYAKDTVPHYYLAIFFILFGKTLFALRLSSLVLGIITTLLLFSLSKLYLKEPWTCFLVALLYACSASDTILTYSAFDQVIATPLILSSFILLHKAVKSGDGLFFLLSGMLFGLGLAASYYFIILSISFVVYFVHVSIYRVQPFGKLRWGLALFFTSAFMVVMPKLIYLVYQSDSYMQRIRDVSSVDGIHGLRDTLSTLWANLILTLKLLWVQLPDSDSKWLLGINPVLDPMSALAMILGLMILFYHFKKSEGVFVLGIIFGVVLINVISIPMDYRFTNAMPFFYLSMGVTFSFINNQVRQKAVEVLTIGLSFIIIGMNVNIYQRGTLGPTSIHYHLTEIEAIQLAVNHFPDKNVYYSINNPSWISTFFAFIHPELRFRPITTLEQGEPDCSTDTLLDLHHNLYRIMNQSQSDIKNLVLFFNPSPCNIEIKKYLKTQIDFSESDWPLKTHEGPVSLTALDHFRYFDPAVERQKLARIKQGKLDAIRFSPEKTAIGGIKGEYYTTGSSTKYQRIDPEINFDWGETSPDPAIPHHGFSIDWQGYLSVPRNNTYEFILESADGSRLWIDDTLIVNNWGDHPVEESRGFAYLKSGWHLILVSYDDRFEDPFMKVYWTVNGKKEIIPSDKLCCRNLAKGPMSERVPSKMTLPDYFFGMESGEVEGP